jgi:hypothetical protein
MANELLIVYQGIFCLSIIYFLLVNAESERNARKAFIVERKLENNFQEYLANQKWGNIVKYFRGF